MSCIISGSINVRLKKPSLSVLYTDVVSSYSILFILLLVPVIQVFIFEIVGILVI